MGDELTETTRRFLQVQIDGLGPLGFVRFGPGGDAPPVEVSRTQTGALVARAPADAVTAVPLARRARLAEAGWRSAHPTDPAVPWEHAADDGAAALALAVEALRLGWDAELGETVDVVHGNRQAEHAAALTLAALRGQIEPLLAEAVGFKVEQDTDGDYSCPLQGLRMVVLVRAVPAAPAVVRLAVPTNIGVTIGAELGIFLSRLNLGLDFGRFVLDTEHQTVWFEETLLGTGAGEEELRFMVEWVPRAAAEWAPRLQHMFGGITQREFDSARLGELKPQAWRRS